jgi:hypothetical protein
VTGRFLAAALSEQGQSELSSRQYNTAKKPISEAVYSSKNEKFNHEVRCVPVSVTSEMAQMRIIFPGFIRFSGSIARLIDAITLTASPCSANRKSIFP